LVQNGYPAGRHVAGGCHPVAWGAGPRFRIRCSTRSDSG